MTSDEVVPPIARVIENVISDLLTTGGKRWAIDEAAALIRRLRAERDEAQKVARVAAGLCSTMPQFEKMHPEEVLDFIRSAAKEARDDN